MSTISLDELPKQYHHAGPEQRWYRYWEEQGYFASEPDPARQPYTIVIPPPNVTGALHLGHALNGSLQDILIRFKRMQGFNALWVPGTDHAGIATQAVVERRLLTEENKTRHDLGREGLVTRILAWKDEYEQRILGQLKRLGCSCDWRRTRFTLDPMCARAVRHTFFKFFQEQLIYRGKRLVNWDTFLQTAVSDDEVFHETVEGHFWHFQYPVINPLPGEPAHVTIATTRPETMLGDTAVAVHPDPTAALNEALAELKQRLSAAPERQRDELSAQLEELEQRRDLLLPRLLTLAAMARSGRRLRLPLLDREIRLVTDPWARPELGSGCVKITPAHDPNDYEVGRRLSLPMINILNPAGTLNANAGPYQGLAIAAARRQVVADLEKLGLVELVEDRQIELAHSDRSKTPIEPLLADQWFVKMDQLAQSAMDAVTDERVKIFPVRYRRGYLDWLSEKRDWPVSRQLWWGHQIPIWYAPTATEDELRRAFAGRDDVIWQRDTELNQWLICSRELDLPADAVPGHELRREEDVLDTWFSSALWPHSTLGWPEPTSDLAYYYPTSALITSREIITLWVARMVLTGLHNVGDVPFREVFIHPKILDAHGEGMSKSKGNGVDPIDVMEKCGADALRFALAHLTTETQDVRMSVEFECPHCGKPVEQTRENRTLPRIACTHCRQPFSTQWASKPADVALKRGAVTSDRFELARNFCNKLWNASRFVLSNLEGYGEAAADLDQLALEDRWLLSRLSTVTAGVTTALDGYRFADATRLLYEFAWDEFCSFYLEMIKNRLQDPVARGLAQRMLVHTLDTLLRLLHPVIPFLTEEIWHLLGGLAPERGLERLRATPASVMIADWPIADDSRRDSMIEARFSRFQEVLRSLREIRSRQNIAPRATAAFMIRCGAETAALLRPMEPYFKSMAGAIARDFGPDVASPEVAAHVRISEMDIYVDLAGLIDFGAEISRHEKTMARLREQIAAKEKKLAKADFTERAPPAVVAKERESLAHAKSELESLEQTIAGLRRGGGDAAR